MTRKELESVYSLKKELRMWQDRLAELQADIALSPKAIDGMPFQHTNETSNPTERKAIKLAEVSRVIDGKICEIQWTLADIELFIMGIDDSIMRQIIEYRCVKCMEWKYIAAKLGPVYTDDSVRQMYHRFVSLLDDDNEVVTNVTSTNAII